MNKENLPLVNPISKARLMQIIKSAGLQAYMFDPSLFSVECDGLQYRMRIINDILYLESVVLLTDVHIQRLEKHEIDEYKRWLKMRSSCIENPF
jgi:hypothetical protein